MQPIVALIAISLFVSCTSDDDQTTDDGAGDTADTGGDALTDATPDSGATGDATGDAMADAADAHGGDDGDPSNDVLEIALRQLNEGQDVAAFEAARDAFVALLRERDGVEVDREFRGIFDFTTFGEPSPAVFTGMTQYDSATAFADAGAALGSSAEAGAFFATFTARAFVVVQPLDGYPALDLATLAAEPDDVVEIAVRDLSRYEGFDAAAYAGARDAFLALLTAQPGVVREYQWVSVTDPNVVVGMTVYDDAAAFGAVAANEAVTGSAEAAAFLGGYPPLTGFAHAVVR